MLILFKPWRTASDLQQNYSTWKEAFERFQFSESAQSVMLNMTVKRECCDAKKESDHRKHTGTATASDHFGLDNAHSDMDSLGILFRRDSSLHDAEDDDFDMTEGKQSVGAPGTVTEVDRVIQDAEHYGLFSTERLDFGHTKGAASEIGEGDDSMISMQSQLMAELKKLKRPAINDVEHELPAKKRTKQPRITKPKMTMRELKSCLEVTNVTIRDNTTMDPWEEIENIIEDTGIHDNVDQERAFRIAAEHFVRGDEDQLFLYIMGIGGSGKSFVIKALVGLFRRCGASEQLLLSAPTGAAAVLIDGYTIHALTFLPQSKYPPDPKKLEDIWRLVKYLIIDEISMISPSLLSQISRRMSATKSWDPIASLKPFGGVNVIFTGDFGQLTPVKTYAMFSHELVNKLKPNVIQREDGQSSMHGAYLW
jgi:ATP-dependent DNA helicase PIF1